MCVGLECHSFSEKTGLDGPRCETKSTGSQNETKVGPGYEEPQNESMREQHGSSAKLLRSKSAASSASTPACIPPTMSEPAVMKQQAFSNPFESMPYAREDLAVVMEHLPVIDPTAAGFQASLSRR